MTFGSKRCGALFGASMIAILAMAAPAQAQDDPAVNVDPGAEDPATPRGPTSSPAADAPAGAGDEIVVVARRRAELLQDVPASITAFTSETIETAGIERPADFINLTSNVNLVQTQNAGTSFIVIRGITQARNSEPSVAVIIDGVQQINPSQFNQELFDIEQIEVLKGPQGGLYGRNAIGGAIVIRTKQPTDEFEGQVKAGVDNGPGYWLRGGISGPIADNVKFRLAGSWYDTEGWIPNTFLDDEADPYKDLSLRGTLLIEPSSNFSIDIRGYYSRLETQALYFNIVGNPFDATVPQDVNDTSLPVRVNNHGQNDRDLWGGSLKLTWDAGIGTLTSVTSYDSLEEILTGDQFDFLPIPESFFFQLYTFLPFLTPPACLATVGGPCDLTQSQFLEVDAWSEEIRFTSRDDRRFRYILGAYFVGTDRFISTGNLADTGDGALPVFRDPLPTQVTFLADGQENFAWAVFGNASYDLTDELEIDVSLRYDHDKREQTTLTPTPFLPNVPGFPQGATGDVRKETFDDLQPKVTLTWEPSDMLTLYGGYSRGFRSGGFNQTGVGPLAASLGFVGVGDIYEAETADTLEIGAKASLLDRKLTINAGAFTTKTKNSYFFVFLAANSTQNLGNVDEVRLDGFEIDATLRPLPGLDLNAAVGYTWSEIKEFPDPAAIGNEAPLISRYTYNLGAQYRSALGVGDIGILARADYRRTGRTWWEPFNTTSRDPIDLVDVRLGIEGERWSLVGFAENLFDEEYNAEFSPGGFVFKARPRRYGAELSYRF
jgi:iron complex outermembrane recepter protein